MRYCSTRGQVSDIPFQDAVLMGLARDGGLLLPESFPDVTDRLEAWSKLPYADLAFEIMRLFCDDIPDEDLRRIIAKSYERFRPVSETGDAGNADPQIIPVRDVGPVHLLELFHGPTYAFKDVALQFLGNLFEYILGKQKSELNIVVATSGDTGSAAIHGVRGRKNIRIFVLHPAGRVSPVQEMQMTTVLDPNVFNIALDGTFDDAQSIVKGLFRDLPFKDALHLGAVNSINWARILAQVVYYFHAAFRVMKRTGAKKVSFSVPTGNFGDIFAGYTAAKMGLPIDKLILATNENDILSRFFNTGSYSRSSVVPTLSPSMDIQIASNFERWLFLHAHGDAAQVRMWMETFAKTGEIKIERLPGEDSLDPWLRAGRADTTQTLATIREFSEAYGYTLDPHSAVGVSVALAQKTDSPIICLCTASPAKFPDAVIRAAGEKATVKEPGIEALKGLPTRKFPLPNEIQKIADFVAEHCHDPASILR